MRHVFGPIPSRRLGRSLGVDPITFKTCDWNCVYCQLGRSTPLHSLRAEYVPTADVVTEVVAAVSQLGTGQIDWITFGGSGEPTLHEKIGVMIRDVKQATWLPVAVLTNGSLLSLPEVRDELTAADAVLPALDAGTDSVYQRINRPHPSLTLDRLVSGLEAFRDAYSGNLWIGVMLVKGLNDDDDELRAIASLLDRVRPDEVHVMKPVRPPSEAWVEGPDDEVLVHAAALLGHNARVLSGRGGSVDVRRGDGEEMDEAILGILDRHPMSLEDLTSALGRCGRCEAGEVDTALGRLADTGRVREVRRLGSTFWASAEAHFGWPPPD